MLLISFVNNKPCLKYLTARLPFDTQKLQTITLNVMVNSIKTYFMILVIGIIQSSCIGDAYVKTSYIIKNKTNYTFYVQSKSTSLEPDKTKQKTNYFVIPGSNAIIKSKRELCGFANCKHLISNQKHFEEIKIFKDSLFTDTLIVNPQDWEIKKNKAILTLKKYTINQNVSCNCFEIEKLDTADTILNKTIFEGFCNTNQNQIKFFKYVKKEKAEPFKGCFGTTLFTKNTETKIYNIKSNSKLKIDTIIREFNQYILE